MSGLSDEAYIERLEREANNLERDVATLTAERDRLRALVGDEAAGGANWTTVDRAEAIRQAMEFHAGQLRWVHEHDARRDERDALAARLAQAERVVEAARVLVALKDGLREDSYYAARPAAWQEAREALAAVDALDGTAGPGEEGGDVDPA